MRPRRRRCIELAAVPLRKDGGVRQQDIDDNKELATGIGVMSEETMTKASDVVCVLLGL